MHIFVVFTDNIRAGTTLYEDCGCLHRLLHVKTDFLVHQYNAAVLLIRCIRYSAYTDWCPRLAALFSISAVCGCDEGQSTATAVGIYRRLIYMF